MEPCGYTANGLLIQPEHYGNIAACPPIEMGCFVTFTNEYGTLGPLQCMDTGGALLEPSTRDGIIYQLYDVLTDFVDEETNQADFSNIPWWSSGVFNVEVNCN